jgi:hypothetical protein
MNSPRTVLALALGCAWALSSSNSAHAQTPAPASRAFTAQGFEDKVGQFDNKSNPILELHAIRSKATQHKYHVLKNMVDFASGTQIATVTCATGACNNTTIINWVEVRPNTGGK